eukprot:m.399752 g.399752  ORF g.399752 m.399752 type:complete len:63 (-) comp16781_c1_seq35:2472-2660(-)
MLKARSKTAPGILASQGRPNLSTTFGYKTSVTGTHCGAVAQDTVLAVFGQGWRTKEGPVKRR